jgi:acetylornithine deacetylase/succinyl-diaminopimelate desuccinylase-like protein
LNIDKFILASLIPIILSNPANALTIYDEANLNLQKYLQINTTNPPGNEMLSAKFLKKILDKERIKNKIFDLGNNRANFYAIIKGDGSKKPIVFLHHMDVVPADSKYWKYPPFSGKIVNGEMFGRGAIDIKGKGIVDLMTIISLKRSGFKSKRDLIFLAVADEEVSSIGSKWIIKNQLELIKNAEFIIDEGVAVMENKKGEIQYFPIGIGEKSPLWLNITFSGNPAHASIPDDNSSVNKAIKAANKIIDFNKNMPFKIIDGIEESIKMDFHGDITKLKGYDKDIVTSLKNKDFLNEISKVPEINAMIRNTISITGLKGSDKINTIPNEASIRLDCRLLPNENKDDFLNKLRAVINDKTAKIKIEEYYKSKYSSPNTDFVKALTISANKIKKNAKIVPRIFTSSTDSSLYRILGINVYGFESYRTDDEILSTPHANNERIKVTNIKYGIDFLKDIIKELN